MTRQIGWWASVIFLLGCSGKGEAEPGGESAGNDSPAGGTAGTGPNVDGAGGTTSAASGGTTSGTGGGDNSGGNAPIDDPGIWGDPTFTVVSGPDDDLEKPVDLDFHPAAARANELWVTLEGTPETGGTTVILFDAGTNAQTAETYKDGNARHFLSMPTAVAFSPDNENWANSTGIFDANHRGDPNRYFTGPSLWSSDLEVYAVDHGPGTNGSHLDMLHESPHCMGIAHDHDNAFWVFDGYHGHIVYYDFVDDHGPGLHDHSDGIIRRYEEVEVVRNPDVPSHMMLESVLRWLYINDTGNSRVVRLDTSSGVYDRDVEEVAESSVTDQTYMRDAVHEVFVSSGLTSPSGMALDESHLYVSDAATQEIIAFDLTTGDEVERLKTPATKLIGLAFGPSGKLWYVDYGQSEVVRID